MIALLSDIHGNLEALRAVMADINSQGITEIYSLGDIVGYGPNPIECVEIIQERCTGIVMGNHDYAALVGPIEFNPRAAQAIDWTIRELRENSPDSFAFLSQQQSDIVLTPESILVHGSPSNPLDEYVLPHYANCEYRMKRNYDVLKKYSFQGHTHIPGTFTPYTFTTPSYNADQLPDSKAMINVGSVGQPRDNDPRACYLVLDLDKKTYQHKRVQYDMHSTIKKIMAIPDLDDYLGRRLLSGH